MKKLIIWDFDGVLADSEKLWIRTWVESLKEVKGIDLTEEQKNYCIVGLAVKTKIERVHECYPQFVMDDEFLNILQEKTQYLIDNEMEAIPGVEKILEDKSFFHCLATGGTTPKTMAKLKKLGFEKYFDTKYIFTADMVEKGKPSPDIYELAVKTAQCPISQCVVVEDSIAGITAAKQAHLKTIAFLGATGNNNEDYKQKVLNAGADKICVTMNELHNILKNEIFDN